MSVDVDRLPSVAADEVASAFRPALSRMGIAFLAVVGALVSAYLALYKLGYMGIIQCAGGGCAVVQASDYAVLLGIPVAVWGVGAIGGGSP
jgi:uncharacterized membrane protein